MHLRTQEHIVTVDLIIAVLFLDCLCFHFSIGNFLPFCRLLATHLITGTVCFVSSFLAPLYSILKRISGYLSLLVSTADFGFARHLQNNMMAATLCGSPMYMASNLHPSSACYPVSHALYNPGMLLTPGSRGHHVSELWRQGWPVEYRNHSVSVPDWESPISSKCWSFSII